MVKAYKENARGRAASGIPPIAFILASTLLWSTGGLFIKMTTLNAFELSFGRCALAAVAVAFVTRREGFGLNFVTGINIFLYAALLLLFVMANKLTTAANAIFLQYTAPVYILLLEPLLYGERFRRRDLLTISFCVAGMSLFFVGELRPQDVQGNLVALGSGVCFALFILLMRHPRAREVNRASVVIYGNLLLTLVTAPAFIAGMENFSTVDIACVAYLGLVQLGIGYALFTYGMAHGVRSLDAGIVGYIEPVLNPLWVFLFLGERPAKWALIGGAIIITTVLFHTLRGARSALKRRDESVRVQSR